MAWRPHGHARVSARNPRAWGECDRCGFTFNLARLQWQAQYTGTTLNNTRQLVCEKCHDTPNEQQRARIIPADPRPVLNPRPPRYSVD